MLHYKNKISTSNTFLLALFSLCLIYLIFKWIHYLVNNNFIQGTYENKKLNDKKGKRSAKESFENNAYKNDQDNQVTKDFGMPNTTHNVDLPLTTTYSCENKCGPPNRCSKTGEQCMADIDCPGCQPYVPPLPGTLSVNIPGENDAGKLTVGMTPNYSQLTTDMGTEASLITNQKFAKPAQPNFGVNTWSAKFNETRQMFDDRYKPAGLNRMPTYPERYSLSGEFIDEGPLASNSYLS